MRIVVTGGAGFIGSHLVDKLFAEGHEVYVLDDLTGGRATNVTKAPLHFVDCRDYNEVSRFFDKLKPEVVYHLAANAAENKAQFSPIDITSRNYDCFIKVLTAFIRNKGKRFIFTSSIAAYGALQTPFYENQLPEPEDLYGITKYAAEQSLHVMSKVHDFEYVITRPHNVYGERQNMRDPYRNVVTIWMNAILRNAPCVIYGEGEQVRQFSYISDVVNQLYKCLDVRSGGIYNLGHGRAYKVSELLDVIEQTVGKEYQVRRTFLPMRPQEVMQALSDHSLCNLELGKAEVTLPDGIARTWKWCQQEGPQWPVFTPIEIESEKMPLNWRKEEYDK